MEPIFNSEITSVDTDGGSHISFKDCPNKCVDGYYVDPYKHKRIRCLYCADKRKMFAKSQVKTKETNSDINELLNLPKSFTGYGEFDINSIIPEFAQKDLVEGSVDKLKNEMEPLINNITDGTVPSYSIMFNLGKKAFENNFIYSYLLRAYISGLIVSPLVSAFDVCILRNNAENGIDVEKYRDLMKSDVCVIVIDAGATYSSINAVKGLMQLRAHYDKSTMIFTNAWGSHIKDLCSEGDVKCKNLASLFSVEYTETYKERERKYESSLGSSHSNISNQGLSANQFSSLMKPTRSL